MYLSELFPDDDKLFKEELNWQGDENGPGIAAGETVVVKDPRTEHTLRMGKFVKVGPSGLAHVELTAPLKDDGIVPHNLVGKTRVAVPISWLHPSIGKAWPQPVKTGQLSLRLK